MGRRLSLPHLAGQEKRRGCVRTQPLLFLMGTDYNISALFLKINDVFFRPLPPDAVAIAHGPGGADADRPFGPSALLLCGGSPAGCRGRAWRRHCRGILGHIFQPCPQQFPASAHSPARQTCRHRQRGGGQLHGQLSLFNGQSRACVIAAATAKTAVESDFAATLGTDSGYVAHGDSFHTDQSVVLLGV